MYVVVADRRPVSATDSVMMVMTRVPFSVFFSGYPAADVAAAVVAKVVAGAAPPAGSGAAPVMSVTCHRPAVIRNEIE